MTTDDPDRLATTADIAELRAVLLEGTGSLRAAVKRWTIGTAVMLTGLALLVTVLSR